MGQKTNPISNRLGVIRGWDSNWYGGKDYAAKILEDTKIREYLNARLSKASLSKIVIEKKINKETIIEQKENVDESIEENNSNVEINKGELSSEEAKNEFVEVSKENI